MNIIIRILNNLIRKAAGTCKMVVELLLLLYDTIAVFFSGGKKGIAAAFKQIIAQTLFTGVEAFWLVGAIGLLSGIVIIIQAMTNMPKLGVGEYFGKILVIVVVRELGPFVTSIVVAGRSGSALAVYIGNMRVSKELTALEVMGIDPIRFVVLPAFAGMVISIICLSVYFDIIAIIGGYFIAQFKVAIPINIFMSTVIDAMRPQDLLISMFKNVIFGLIIGLMSCYYGLNVKNIRQVPQAAMHSVVGCMIGTLSINIVITIFVFLYSL